MLENYNVAIAHDWLAGGGGAEKVFEEFARLLPQADLYALTLNPEASLDLNRPVGTTFLQRTQFSRDRRNLTLPLMPLAWRALGDQDYDVVLSISHAFSRFFPSKRAVHFNYVHTPLRYAWVPEIDGRGSGRLLAPARAALRAADRWSSRKVSYFAGSSRATAQRVTDFYGRDARVIHCPVDLNGFEPSTDLRSDYLFGFSRWIPYKRLDLVIEVGNELGMPVVIAGSGPDEDRLRSVAARSAVPVEFVVRPSDSELVKLYQQARALVFPAIEDFGIVPLEAQACGTPVAAVGIGGSADTVLDGVSGALAASQELEDLVAATKRALSLTGVEESGPTHAATFSPAIFASNLKDWLEYGIGESDRLRR